MSNKKGINQAVILAAGERKEFDRPVGFLDIEENIIIERLIRILKEHNIERVIIVAGYKKSILWKFRYKRNRTGLFW